MQALIQKKTPLRMNARGFPVKHQRNTTEQGMLVKLVQQRQGQIPVTFLPRQQSEVRTTRQPLPALLLWQKY